MKRAGDCVDQKRSACAGVDVFMILRPKPTALELFFTLQGSVLPAILPKICVITIIASVVTMIDTFHPKLFAGYTVAPFTLLGLALSIFLGFRNNACYDRWWEARKQWGQMVNEMRAIGREVAVLLEKEEPALRRRIIHLAIAFPHAAAARLRDADAAERSRSWLPSDRQAVVTSKRGVAQAILQELSRETHSLLRRGVITDSMHYMFDARFSTLSSCFAACERIHTTPLPFAYTLLLHRTAVLFCTMVPFGIVSAFGVATPVAAGILAYAFFGLDALGDELEEPFGTASNDLPLDAMVRVMEIDLLESIDEPNLPPAAQPVGYLLS